MSDAHWEHRGRPWDYDPGPPRNRKWVRLFSETPNYRGLGVSVKGREAYRWHFGPMFYRGRLGDNRVKVLVVGQEGAQDESLAHRSFAGGTGARMQHLLHHLGITESYLFLNTFVYPIFNQYDRRLALLAQDESSPIRRHREEIFDYAATRNDLQLAIAVGRAAKESLASWVESHGGDADPEALHLADSDRISGNLRMVGVMHPGGASKGGSVSDIADDFKRALRRIDRWAKADPSWLPADPGANRSSPGSYEYRSAPIPFRDLPYGTAWRIGRGGTSSNRRDGQTAIQMFSAAGRYDNRGDAITYEDAGPDSPDGYQEDPGDLAYEPPRRTYRGYDSGPGSGFDQLLQGGLTGLGWPDFTQLGLGSHPSFGTGPVYRGRLRHPSLLVVADQQSHDDLFTGRALTGEAGQRLQAFLLAAGVTTSYAILRVLPVDTLGDEAALVRTAVDDPGVQALYAEAIRRSDPEVLLVMGPNARRLVDRIAPAVAATVNMRAPSQGRFATDWRRALHQLEELAYHRDLAEPGYGYDGEREQIPRVDLPYGVLRWQATSGNRARRAVRAGRPSFDYYKVTMPAWAAALPPAPLLPAEQQAADGLGGGS